MGLFLLNKRLSQNVKIIFSCLSSFLLAYYLPHPPPGKSTSSEQSVPIFVTQSQSIKALSLAGVQDEEILTNLPQRAL